MHLLAPVGLTLGVRRAMHQPCPYYDTLLAPHRARRPGPAHFVEGVVLEHTAAHIIEDMRRAMSVFQC